MPVLVILDGDGAVDVYGEGLAVTFAHRLTVQTQEAERRADQYLDLTLPRKLRALYMPVNLCGQDVCRRRTVESEAEWRWRLELVRELVALAKGLPKVPAAIERARRVRA